MSPTPHLPPRTFAALLAAVLWLAHTAPVEADPKPFSKEEQARIDGAIDKGVAFLKDAQSARGDFKWRMYRDGRFVAAQCALPAYALLESGVPADDPVIQKAADFFRVKVRGSDFTYELSLALLFLDRLGDPRDKKLIQTLAVRLIAGQHHTGGWSYRCPMPDEQSERNLLRALTVLDKAMRDKPQTREQALAGMAAPPALQTLPAFRSSASLIWREPPSNKQTIADSAERFSPVGRTDNSNTQFALLGLWAAQRHSVPVAPTFEIMVDRFERSHAYPSGLWSYTLDEEGGSRSMICVGLMALAIGRGLQMPTAGAAIGAKKDVHVLKGLAALERRVGRPAGRMDRPVPFHDLYFLWSLERVAMLYDLRTLGDKDWYRWGAESLVTNQAKGGFWTGASPNPEWGGKRNYDYKATLSTAFALLFLKRSHPMKDLTPKLPFTAKELNAALASLRADDKFPLRPATAPVPSRDRGP
ncbi:MAG TPA: hypothetical protein VH575_05665 [Gemmataceae bacterium]|jgi:hypothetical protein